MATGSHARRTLTDGAVYSLALTPHQYIARQYNGVYRDTISWVLVPVPELQASTLLSAPVLYVDHDGRLCVSSGATERTTDDLDFTGRTEHGNR